MKKGQGRKKKVFLLLCIRSMRTRRKDEGTDHLQRSAECKARLFSIFIWQERHKWELSLNASWQKEKLEPVDLGLGDHFYMISGVGTGDTASLVILYYLYVEVPWGCSHESRVPNWTREAELTLLNPEEFRNLKEKMNWRSCSAQQVCLEGCSSYPKQPLVCYL